MFCFMLVVMLSELISVGFLIPLVSIFTGDTSNETAIYVKNIISRIFNTNTPEDSLFYAILIYAVFFTLKNIISLIYYWAQAKFVFTMRARMSHDLLVNYIRKPYLFHVGTNSSELIRNAFSEVGTVVGAGVQPIMQIVVEILVVCGLLFILFHVDANFTFIILGVSILAISFIYQTTKAVLYNWGKNREFHDGKRIQYLQQALSSVKDIKINNIEQWFEKSYEEHNQATASATIKQSTTQQIPRLAIELILVLTVLILLSINIASGLALEEIATVITVFLAASFRMLPSANRISTSLQQIRFGLPVIQTIYSDLAIKTKLSEARDSHDCNIIFEKSLEANNINFSYPGSKRVILKEVSFKITKGDKLAIIGKSGSGKSTLLNLILGLLKPSSGELLVDGRNIQDNINSWVKNIAYVPQDIYLTDDSLLRNIAFGIDEDCIDHNALLEAVTYSQLGELIQESSDGLDTIVGERGIRLSGGQKQRIGLARALYLKPKVLVLDEATSSLDVNTENKLMQAVYNLDKDITILIVTHRENTIYGCNKVIELSNGCINHHSPLLKRKKN